MSVERHIGSGWVRALTCVLGALFLAGMQIQRNRPPEHESPLWFFATVAVGVMTAISLLHSHRVLYQGFLAFGERFRVVIIAVLFGTCYLVVVPLFAAIVFVRDPLRLRRRSHPPTWIQHPRGPIDPQSLERMG